MPRLTNAQAKALKPPTSTCPLCHETSDAYDFRAAGWDETICPKCGQTFVVERKRGSLGDNWDTRWKPS